MGSSPPPFSGAFEDFCNGTLDPGATFGASSPIQSGSHATFNYDPTAASPYTRLGKTPTARARRGGNEAYLVSPLSGPSTSLHARGLSAPTQGTPKLTYKRHAVHTPVKVVDHNTSQWEDNASEMPNGDLEFGASFDEQTAYQQSPIKPMRAHSVAVTPVPLNMPMPHHTPTHSPRILSAPSTIQRPQQQRSATGLGSPSVHRSGNRHQRNATVDMASWPASPSAMRRRNDVETALAMPLSRALSSSSYAGPSYQSNRIVSGASAFTTSTSYELMSPSLEAYSGPDFGIIQSHSLPELVGSQHPSPPLSAARSPVCGTPQQPATVYYTSPDADNGHFINLDPMQHQLRIQQQQPPQGDMSLMGGVNHVMSQPMSAPNSASMASVMSFPGGHGNYRQGTLNTIIETPMISQDGLMGFQSVPLASQPEMASQPQFQTVPYPQVPGMYAQQSQPGPSAESIHAWSAQTQAQTQSYANPNMPPGHGFTSHAPPQRHASASFVPYQPPMNLNMQQPMNLVAPPMGSRSVSAPFQRSVSSSSMPSLSHMPMDFSSGGLFGPSAPLDESSMMQLQSFDQGPSAPYQQMPSSSNPSIAASPDTPRKRKMYPRVGLNRLRPGPKPKVKSSPRKGKGVSSSEPGSSPLGSENPMPSLDLANSSLAQIDEYDQPQDEDDESVKAEPKSLTFGPDLATVAMQRTLSGTILPPGAQPQLVIQPPRSQVGAAAPGADPNNVAGLPRQFLEKLYTTFLTLDGSMTGQPVKRFKCLIEGCERHFPRKSAIHSHIQTHLEDKPFMCTADDCGAAFVRQHDLRRHMRIHSGTKPFPCPCGKGFARGDALHRHRQRGICSGSIVPRRGSRSPPRFEPY